MRDEPAEMMSRYARRRSRLYRALRPPRLVVHNRAERLLPACAGPKLFMGGAGGSVPAGFLNVDVTYLPGVDVVADVTAMPFRTASVGGIECDAVLEHVSDPRRAVSELLRVLRPGGFLHIVVPFCHPYHGYPSDYQRWTEMGLRQLLASDECELMDVGLRTGPTATLLAMVCEYARLFGGRVGYAIAAWILWPLRYLDLWLNRRPQAHILANHLYALARKK